MSPGSSCVFSIPGSTAGVEGDQFSPDWLLSELSEYFSVWLPAPQLESFRQVTQQRLDDRGEVTWCAGGGLHLLLGAGPQGDQLPLPPLPHLQLLALDGLLRPGSLIQQLNI